MIHHSWSAARSIGARFTCLLAMILASTAVSLGAEGQTTRWYAGVVVGNMVIVLKMEPRGQNYQVTGAISDKRMNLPVGGTYFWRTRRLAGEAATRAVGGRALALVDGYITDDNLLNLAVTVPSIRGEPFHVVCDCYLAEPRAEDVRQYAVKKRNRKI